MIAVNVRRYISAFAKAGDHYIGDLNFIKQPSVEMLRTIFPFVDEKDPMYDEYPIDAAAELMLAPLIDGKFDLYENYYFLSCDKQG
ncbi:DUF7683 domain-containing protein [Cupriavidus numazuensis]|uniref:DUF7683 domain-containing protein n=1 Tax=Cupriavidus numazuensis TaxID=221992 RepID=A0ABN7QF33_9BURK|nr:hypothetical protein [Cupriavidus numazuensis]CAG2159125.1 hypothetical protein LMG26411_06460 [Cupriavidus numazuensis]